MKVLTKNKQVLVLQRGTKVGFLIGTGFVMFCCVLIAGAFLWAISISFGSGWWGLFFLPLAVWLLWLVLHRFLSNEEMVTIYRLDKGSNRAAIEFQGLRQSKAFELPLYEIQSLEVRFLGAQYIGHGYTHVRYQLYLLTNSGRAFAMDQGIGRWEKRELEVIARHFREFLFIS